MSAGTKQNPNTEPLQSVPGTHVETGTDFPVRNVVLQLVGGCARAHARVPHQRLRTDSPVAVIARHKRAFARAGVHEEKHFLRWAQHNTTLHAHNRTRNHKLANKPAVGRAAMRVHVSRCSSIHNKPPQASCKPHINTAAAAAMHSITIAPYTSTPRTPQAHCATQSNVRKHARTAVLICTCCSTVALGDGVESKRVTQRHANHAR